MFACLWLAIKWRIESNRSKELERRIDELTKELTVDPLTEILNRKGFIDLAERHFRRESRPDGRLAMAYFDLDNFKTLNDKLGHSAGDEVLRIFAKILQGLFRPGDALARLGGDEFVIVSPRVLDVALATRCQSARIQLEQETHTRFGIACSATYGMASIAGENLVGASFTDLMSEVEREMRNNKQERR